MAQYIVKCDKITDGLIDGMSFAQVPNKDTGGFEQIHISDDLLFKNKENNLIYMKIGLIPAARGENEVLIEFNEESSRGLRRIWIYSDYVWGFNPKKFSSIAKPKPTLMPEWLERQFDNVERTVDGWSEGKKEAAGLLPRKTRENVIDKNTTYLNQHQLKSVKHNSSNIKSIELRDCSTNQVHASVPCGNRIPQIGSLITIETQSEDISYRVRDIHYKYFEGSDDTDCVIIVNLESRSDCVKKGRINR